MQTIKERNAVLIEEKITKLIKDGKYSSFSDFKRKNQSLKDFCKSNNFLCIYRSFSSQFTNLDYINLLEKMKEKAQIIDKKESEVKKTTIENETFIDLNSEQKENTPQTLIGLENTSNNINSKDEFNSAKKWDTPVANFKKIDDIDVTKLSRDEEKKYQAIQNNTEGNNVNVYFDENGNMTNKIKDEYNNYSSIDNINGEQQLINHETTSNIDGKAKQKVLSQHNKPSTNISAAFTNTLILSFIIGSFFGVVFLAIYLKVMH